ncbi:unnamed protein product [Periconia digitata]|uniref:Uncharacterized protein n=1 Tax=Periconia digitata TaxID=1303443 RepID=A0A9W4UU66_9PLEO|nr:unnamed protein product [Periconia digitata]
MANTFDFNDFSQPLPWNTNPGTAGPGFAPRQNDRLRIHRFHPCRDELLLAYLSTRGISPGFLAEIDQFFDGHPEIFSCGPGEAMIRYMNDQSPMEAYRYFIRGYTRPARYIYSLCWLLYAYSPLRSAM